MQIYIFFKKVSEWMHSVHSPRIQGEARHFSKTGRSFRFLWGCLRMMHSMWNLPLVGDESPNTRVIHLGKHFCVSWKDFCFWVFVYCFFINIFGSSFLGAHATQLVPKDDSENKPLFMRGLSFCKLSMVLQGKG